MKKGSFDTIGNILFDYIILTVLFAGSLVLVVPLLPLIIGFQNYAECDLHSRKLTMIFTHIRDHRSMIIRWTMMILVMIFFSISNIIWLSTPYPILDSVVRGFSYVVLLIALTLIIHSPTVLKNMDVTFKQWIRNSMMLILSNPLHYVLSIGLIVILSYGAIQSIVLLIIGLPLVLYAVARLSWINLTQIKEKMK